MKTIEIYLQSYLPYVDVSPLAQCFSVKRELKKKELLIQPGQPSPFMAFIQKGAFRVYFINNQGQELTTWFSFAGMMVTDMLAYYKNNMASFYVEAIENSQVLIAQKNKLEKLFLENPSFQKFGKEYAEMALVKVMERMVSLQTKSAEDRYKELLANPEYLQAIPLKHLATYLGITDTSLSRIRKNISL